MNTTPYALAPCDRLQTELYTFHRAACCTDYSIRGPDSVFRFTWTAPTATTCLNFRTLLLHLLLVDHLAPSSFPYCDTSHKLVVRQCLALVWISESSGHPHTSLFQPGRWIANLACPTPPQTLHWHHFHWKIRPLLTTWNGELQLAHARQTRMFCATSNTFDWALFPFLSVFFV